jgi:hypothetical protein
MKLERGYKRKMRNRKPGRPRFGKRPLTNAERVRRHRLRKAQRGDDMVETTTTGNGDALQKVPPPLPETRTDLLAQYRLKRKRSINDLVEEIVLKLWDDDDFQKYVYPIYDSQAVEGSLKDDNFMMAQMVRAVAKNGGNAEVAAQNMHTIRSALTVVLRRFGVDRRTREEQAELPLAPPAAPAAE